MATLDSDYLKRTVGTPLTNALTAMVTDQPKDSVEYLGQYLLRYVEREEGKAAQAELFAQAATLASAQEQKKADAEAEVKLAEENAAKPLPGQEDLELLLGVSKEVPDLYERILELVKAGTGATSCYIGVKGETAEGPDGEPSKPTITWLAGTGGSNMADCAQVGVAEDDGGEGPPPEGVSFELFKGAEPPEGAEGEEEGGEPGLVYPTELVIPNVVRHPNMKFFGPPKIGAYAAVPIKFKSCLQADGIGEEEDGSKAPKYTVVEMLIGMHTMGQAGRQFTSEELGKAKAWAAKVASALERSELTTWGVEVEKVEVAAEKEKGAVDALATAKAEAAAIVEDGTAKLSEDMPTEARELAVKKLEYEGHMQVVKAVEQGLKDLFDRRLPPKAEAVRVLHALLYTLLVPKEKFVEGATRKVNWERMRKSFDDKLVAKLKKYDPSSEANAYPRYARVEEIRRLLEIEELPTETLYNVLLEWATKATDVREAAVAARAAAAEAAAALAAAEAEEE